MEQHQALNELAASRMTNDIVGRRGERESLTNMVKETLDYDKAPLRLRLKLPRGIRHVSEGIAVARIVSFSKLRSEEHEVVIFREGSADVARLLASATAAVHQEQNP